MSKTLKFQVLPDEHIEEDDTVSGDELFNDIMAGFAELEEFAQAGTATFSVAQGADKPAKTLRVSEVVNGEYIEPTMLTQEELTARRTSREAIAPVPGLAGYVAAHRPDGGSEPVVGQVTAQPAATGRPI